MKLKINPDAKIKLEEKNLKDQYIKLFYCGFGWTAGLQMVFEEEVDDEYEVFDVEGYKIAIEKDILGDYDYIEVKYSDNFIQKGFYPNILDPEKQ